MAVLMSSAAIAEEGGEHESKPPPKPSSDSPVTQVRKLPVVIEWKKWMVEHHTNPLMVWGESIVTVDTRKCWEVAIGQNFKEGLHAARYFCVPQDGSEILVENVHMSADDDTTYMPYSTWVKQCEPAGDSWGKC